MKTTAKNHGRFWIGAVAIIIVIAGVLSVFASSYPDGLDWVTSRGCYSVHTDQGTHLVGSCIAQHSVDYSLSTSLLADYAIHDNPKTTPLAGILGVIIVIAVTGGSMWLIRRRRTALAPGGANTP